MYIFAQQSKTHQTIMWHFILVTLDLLLIAKLMQFNSFDLGIVLAKLAQPLHSNILLLNITADENKSRTRTNSRANTIK